MAGIQQPTTVAEADGYVSVRYRDPEGFETIETPDWAETAADSVVEGSELRLGRRADAGNWIPLEVRIPGPVDASVARRQANEILQRVDY